ncbi:hypothetical protein HK097_001208 [Rhizophlyctis rosea]|uniref:Uncharacterized protein n=1 Tax=Rhizophlyctis rosea TaxID=64517 RepID=A0AAD5SHS3_9FUNG|nr:hypothetical protein HK097_001208 [Rhizophlyctis rosea]
MVYARLPFQTIGEPYRAPAAPKPKFFDPKNPYGAVSFAFGMLIVLSSSSESGDNWKGYGPLPFNTKGRGFVIKFILISALGLGLPFINTEYRLMGARKAAREARESA